MTANEIKEAWEDDILALYKGLIDDADADIDGFGKKIVEMLFQALEENNMEVVSTLRINMKLLGEIHRLKVVGAQWRAINLTTKTIFTLAFKTLELV